jgi:ribosomal protein S18 acetylase RimI-like enzyme
LSVWVEERLRVVVWAQEHGARAAARPSRGRDQLPAATLGHEKGLRVIRRLRSPWLCPSLRYGFLYGEVHTTQRIDGVAVWLVPEHPAMTVWGMLRAGIVTTRLRLGRKAFSRLTQYLKCSARAAEECVPGPHWHLLQLAVDPSCQGRGIGGALMQPVLARADADGLPCYLDTFNERSITFYERHRFTVVTQVEVPDGGPRFWTMLRLPATTGGHSA